MGEWISVNDRLPELQTNVLVIDNFGTYDISYVRIDGSWYRFSEDPDYMFPTHWMPLPEPPEAK